MLAAAAGAQPRQPIGTRKAGFVQDSLAIASVPGYPRGWAERLGGDGPLLAPDWHGWQRLKAVVRPGDKVFLLCNFVQERRRGQSAAAQLAKCVHGAVVHGACESVLAALGDGGEVLYGNAPLQSSDWGRLMRDTGAGQLEGYYQQRGKAVRQRDLRLLVRPRSAVGTVPPGIRRDAGSCVEIDLGQHSLLHELVAAGAGEPKFRVRDYDAARTEQCQNAVNHKYIVSRDVLEADVVVHIPKLKTHEKVGITCALKGVVGMVGSKECLAHYRAGGRRHTGDEFPGDGRGRTWQTKLHEGLHRAGGQRWMRQAGLVLDRNATRVLSRCGLIYGGAWHGNDTCWRMALDLARIVRYADRDGVMQDTPQRTNVCLVDGIVGGEGEGPLSPSPVAANTLLFAEDMALADAAAARLMGFDPTRIPLLQRALDAKLRWPVTTANWQDAMCRYDAEARPLAQIGPVLGRPFKPSAGWARHLR